MVLNDPTPAPAGSSAEMQGILAILLQKSPLDRGEWSAVRAHSFWQGSVPGEQAEADALPIQPHLEELRLAWNQTETAAAASRASPTAAATAISGPAPLQAPIKASSPNGAVRAEAAPWESVDTPEEPVAKSEPPRHANPSPASRHGYGASGVETAPVLQQGATAYPPGSLRAQLGATCFARASELVTPAETGVKPISRNPQIEEPEPLESSPAHLPFAPLRLEEIVSRSHAEAEVFFSKVYKLVAQGPLEQKIAALRYLEEISCDMQVADLIANSQLLPLILRMLHARRGGDRATGGAAAATPTAAMAAAAPPLRARLLSLIGQLLRHATYLDPAVAELGLFDMLLEGLRERDVIVRRRCIAALGELLFYVATQPTPASPGSQKGVGGEESAGSSSWQVRSSVLQALIQMVCAPGEDEIVQHYAAKTIENISTQCPSIAQQWFFSADLFRGFRVHARHGGWDPFRLCCLAASAHLLRGQPEGGQGEPQLPDPDLISVGFNELAPQGVPHSLQLVAATLLRAPSVDAVALALPDNVVDLLIGVASQPRYHLALRGRAVVLLALLFALDKAGDAKQLRAALDKSLVAHIDRLGREKDRFVVQCVSVTSTVMEVATVRILQALVEGLRQLVATAQPAAALELAATLVQVLPVFLHLLASATLCGCVLSSQALPLLGHVGELCACMPLVQASPGGQVTDPLHQLQPLVLMVMEVLATQQALLLEHASQVVRCILSALAGFLSNNRSDVRLLALKAFSDISMILLNDGHVFDPTSEKPGETTILLEALLCSRVLPLVPTLLSDEPPSPSCAVRLLATLLSRRSAAAYRTVRELGLAPRLLGALEGQPGLTVHACMLSCCLLWGCDVKVAELARVGVLDAVYVVLTQAAEAGPAQLDLALVDAALCTAEEALSQARVPPSGGAAEAGVHPLVRDLGQLSRALPPLAALCAPLAHAKLAPLLDRATTCCQHMVDIARLHGSQVRRGPGIELSARGLASLLEALAAVARWRVSGPDSNSASPSNQGQDAVLARTLQRRLLAVLAWAVTVGGASAEVRADLAAGVEQLLRDRVLGEDATVVSDARGVIAAAVGRGAA